MVTMFFTILSFANDDSLFIFKNNAKKTSLTLNNVNQGNILSVKSNNGVILFKELIKKSGKYTKGFDLTALPNGTYFFEIEKELKISSIPFTVSSNVVLFKKEKEKTIFKPFARVENNLVFVSKLALNKEPLKIDVYFNTTSGYELVYTEHIENTKVIERVYKLNEINDGSYKIVFNSENREFIKLIKK